MAFVEHVVHGETGVVARGEADMADWITRLAGDEALRRSIGVRGRDRCAGEVHAGTNGASELPACTRSTDGVKRPSSTAGQATDMMLATRRLTCAG